MEAALRERGLRNFSIFMDGTEVFLYAEVEESGTGSETSAGTAEVEVRWQAFMADIVVRDLDPATGRPHFLDEVFHLR